MSRAAGRQNRPKRHVGWGAMNEPRSKPPPQRPRDTDTPGSGTPAAGPPALPVDYPVFLADVKARIAAARTRAVLAVNSELIKLYWEIGHEILEREQREGWGARVISRLAADLRREFPDMTGLSLRNLRYMRAFARAWPADGSPPIVQQVVAQLPWGHNVTLLDKLEDRDPRAPGQRADEFRARPPSVGLRAGAWRDQGPLQLRVPRYVADGEGARPRAGSAPRHPIVPDGDGTRLRTRRTTVPTKDPRRGDR
jgi:predicted nuclease of restriction endonuclease-like (RecB) superfamily